MKADLHVHSTASDGTLTPSELVARAIGLGLEVIAICDHDSVSGIGEALAAARDSVLAVVPAVELSAVGNGHDVHVLGYFVDPLDPHLASHLSDLRSARLNRAETMVTALAGAGFEVTIDDVLAHSAGGSVGRSHVARALLAKGHVTDVADAFRRFIGRGRPFYVAKDVRTTREVIGIVREAGGVPVLAHPGVTGLDDAIPGLVAEGLAGIEAYHAEHTPEQASRYAAMAAEMGLLVTGGTDYHGPDAPNPDLGAVELPEGCVEALMAAAGLGDGPRSS